MDRSGTIALSLMAIVQGLGRLSLTHTDRGSRERFASARNLVFNRLIGTDDGVTARIGEAEE
jgi:hypothetical protein